MMLEMRSRKEKSRARCLTTVFRSNAKKKTSVHQRSKADAGRKNVTQKKAVKPCAQKKGIVKNKNTKTTMKPKPPTGKAAKKVQSEKEIMTMSYSSNDDFDLQFRFTSKASTASYQRERVQEYWERYVDGRKGAMM